jgi:hypothetical protein
MERENLHGDAKGKGTSGADRKAESTDAPVRGGLLRSSDEASVMLVERREQAIAIWIGSTGNGRNPIVNGRRQPSCDGTSRMNREVHVRICERLGVKCPGPTRLVSRVTPVHTAQRNCTRDGGWPFEFGNQVSISSHRKLLSSKATVVNVAETSGHDPGRHGRERRAQANRCGSVEMRLGDVKTGG